MSGLTDEQTLRVWSEHSGVDGGEKILNGRGRLHVSQGCKAGGVLVGRTHVALGGGLQRLVRQRESCIAAICCHTT